MKLVVYGKPKINSVPVAHQTTLVRYDPLRELTVVDCDVDIVTLGIAVNVLTAQYEQYLVQLDPEVADKIRCTTRKAVTTYEEDRS